MKGRPSSEPLRLGLVGLGRHGARYARHLVHGDVSGARLTAVWRRDAEAGALDAARLGARFEPELAALVGASDVDAVLGVVPACRHLELAEAAAAAGKPLLLEKPLARTVAEADAILAAFERAGAPLMVAQTLRFDPLVVALGAAARRVGPIRAFAFEQRLENRGLAWEDDPSSAGGGVLIQTAIHTVDALRFTTGAALEVAAATTGRVINRHTEDRAVVVLRATGGLIDPEHGASGTVATSKIGSSRHVRFALMGAEGGLEADLVARTLSVRRGAERTTEHHPERPTVVAALRAFVALARGEAENPIPGAEGRASLAVIEAAYRAAEASATAARYWT